MSPPGCFSISFRATGRRKPGRTRRRRRSSPRPPSSHLQAKGFYTVCTARRQTFHQSIALEVNAVRLVAPATPSRDRGDAAAVTWGESVCAEHILDVILKLVPPELVGRREGTVPSSDVCVGGNHLQSPRLCAHL